MGGQKTSTGCELKNQGMVWVGRDLNIIYFQTSHWECHPCASISLIIIYLLLNEREAPIIMWTLLAWVIPSYKKFNPSSGKQRIQGNRMTVRKKKFPAFLWQENWGKERLNDFHRIVQGVDGRARYRNQSLDLSSNHKSGVRENRPTVKLC